MFVVSQELSRKAMESLHLISEDAMTPRLGGPPGRLQNQDINARLSSCRPQMDHGSTGLWEIGIISSKCVLSVGLGSGHSYQLAGRHRYKKKDGRREAVWVLGRRTIYTVVKD